MPPVIFSKGTIDLVLVPFGLFIMFGYHIYLLYRVLRHPETTVIGYENHNKLAWVARMLKATPSETGIALDVISANISASNTMASLSIALSSLIGTWVASTSKIFTATVIYGDTSQSTTSVKYISLLICFLVAFTAFVQSSRHYVHASFLISTLDSDVPVRYVQTSVLRGGNFWSLGLRALYFATTLLLWFFGPIPMCASCVCMVAALNMLDVNTIKPHPFKFSGAKVPEGYKAVTAKTTTYTSNTSGNGNGNGAASGAFRYLDSPQQQPRPREEPMPRETPMLN